MVGRFVDLVDRMEYFISTGHRKVLLCKCGNPNLEAFVMARQLSMYANFDCPVTRQNAHA